MQHEEIIWAADSLASRWVSMALDKTDRFSNKWGDYVYEHLFVPILEKCDVNITERASVVISRIGDYALYENCTVCLWFTRPHLIPNVIPHKFSHLAEWVEYDCLALSDHSVWSELKTELTAIDKAYREAIAQRDRFVAGVKKIIFHYGSLDEAVAAWPALQFFLSKDMQESRFDGQPRPLPDGVDIAELTSLITRAKLEV